MMRGRRAGRRRGEGRKEEGEGRKEKGGEQVGGRRRASLYGER